MKHKQKSILYVLVVVSLLFFVVVFTDIDHINSQTEKVVVPDQQVTQQQIFYKAKRGPLKINIIESGVIRAKDQAIIKNEVEGNSSIIWIIEEGAKVEQGDLLVELDSSQLNDKLIDQQITAQNSSTALVHARENLNVIKNQVLSDIDNAKLSLRFAKEDLNQYKSGEFPNELKEAQSSITLAHEEKERAEDKLKWSKILFEEKFISQTELNADELATSKTRLNLELAEEKLKLLQNFTYRRKVIELESNVKQADLAFDLIQHKASADVIQAESDLLAKETELSRQKRKLDKLKAQIAKTTILAPSSGLVIYATTAKSNRWRNIQPPDIGQIVTLQQELIYLPKTSSMLAEIKIHESNLEKIKIGLSVRIYVDALRTRTFTGKVSSLSPLPDSSSLWINPDLKVYNIKVALEETDERLRTGMSCRVEIQIQEYENVIYLPLQALKIENNMSTVYVRKAKELIPRRVETGLDNNHMIHIISGINPGEEVSLTPPLVSQKKQLQAKPNTTN